MRLTAADIALAYVRRGWNPVPVPHKQKKPTDSGWQHRVIGEGDVPRFFNGKPQNIGVVLGTSSNGLTDVDLDCDEAISLAPLILPKTAAVFGRPGKRFSHFLYRTGLSGVSTTAVIAFTDPIKRADAKATLVELRIGGDPGAQTIFPGSTHESGEEIAWEENGEPTTTDGAQLQKLVSRLAAASLLARHWCHGDRHKAAYALGGFFSRAGLTDVQAGYLVEGIAKAADDEEWRDRQRAARDGAIATKRKGYPSLVEHFGDVVAKRVATWIEYQASDDEREAPADEPQQPHKKITATPYVWTNPQSIPKREWLYGRLLIRKFITATVAPGGVGKSSLIAAEAMAMVAGKDLLGVSCQPLRVWLWNLEDPQEETTRKIQATALHYKLSAEDIADRFYVDSGRDQSLVVATSTKSGATIVRPVVDDIVSECLARKIDVLVIDPFVSCHEVSENDNTAMDMIAKEWGKVADRINGAVHLVHHTRKMGGLEAEVTAESSRGGKALTDACRVVRAVNRMSKDEGERAGVENHRLHFRVFNDKSNLAPPADASDWFKLQGVDLGNGAPNTLGGGDDIGVVTRWEWPDLTAGVTGEHFSKAATIIRRGRWRENHQAAGWVGHAVAEAMGLDLAKRSDKTKVATTIKMWLASGSLRVVEGEDEKRNVRKFVEVADHVDD